MEEFFKPLDKIFFFLIYKTCLQIYFKDHILYIRLLMAHDIVRLWSSYTKREKTPQIYTKAQTEQKYAIW